MAGLALSARQSLLYKKSLVKKISRVLPSRLGVIRKILLAGVGIWGLVITAFGASLRDEYLISKWETDDGMPENSATAMVQSLDGFLWFGTFNGLVRTDGQNFDVFQPFDTPQLPGAGVVNLHLTSGSRMWISTDRGLVSLEKGVWRRHGEQTSWSNRLVRTFAGRADGPLYVSAFAGAIARLDGDKLVEMPSPLPPGPKGAGFHLHVDGTNGLWALRYDYFGKWNGSHWEAFAAPGVTNEFLSAFPTRDGHLWVLTRGRLLKVSGTQILHSLTLSRPVDAVWSAREDPDGSVWVASYQDGLYHVRPDGQTLLYTMLDGLSYNSLRFTLRDRAGSLWVGTSGGGLLRLRPRLFRTFGSESALPVRSVKSVAEIAPGVMALATYGAGLQELNLNASPSPFTTRGRGGGYAQCVLKDRAGRRWTGFHDSPTALVEGKVERYLNQAEMGGTRVTALFEDADGGIWLGGSDRTMRFAGGQFEPLPHPASQKAASVRGFGQNPLDGSVYGVTRQGMFQWRSNICVAVPGPGGRPLSNGNCLHFDADGTLWVGTDDAGLLRRHGDQWGAITTRHGLPANAIGAILTDADGVFWLATTRGVVRVPREHCHAVLTGRSEKLAAHTFGLMDGMASAECPTGYQPTATRDSQGRLWFATLKGVAMVNPPDFAVDRQPPHARLIGAAYEHEGEERTVPLPIGGAPVHVPPGSTHFGVRFLAPGAFDPARVQYRVEWLRGEKVIAEDESARNYARATLLPPGKYRVRVTAANRHGVWSTVPAELAFVLLPHYWQTGWFRVGAWLAGVATATGAVSLHRRRERARSDERLAQERMLAREQARLATVMEGTTDAVAFMDRELVFRYLNPAGYRMLGVPAGGLPPQLRLREFYSLAGAEALLGTAIPQAIAQGTWSGEVLMVRRDGKEFPVSQVIIAHFVAGELQFLSTIIRNLSDRKASEEALAAALKHARLLAELGRNLAATNTANEAARLVMEAADELIHWDCAWVRLWHPEQARFERVFGFDTVDGQRQEFESTTGALDPGSPMVREVVAQGAKLILRRSEEQSVPGLRPFGGDRRSLSLMFVPMRHGGQVIGVVSVQTYQPNAYNATHLELLQSLADHCAGNLHRIAAERAVRASENRWRLAMSVARLGTWELNLATDEFVASPALAPMLGGPSVAQLSTMPEFHQFIHPEDRPAVDAAIASAKASHGAFRSEFRVVWPDGTIRWIEGRGEVFVNAAGEPERMVGVRTDVTERKSAEAAIRASEDRFRNLVECMAEGLLMTDFDDTIQFANRRMCEMLGFTTEELVGHKGYEVFMLAGQQAETIQRNEQRRTGASETYELPLRHKAGHTVWVEVSAAPFRNSDGRIVGTLGALTDITQRRGAQDRLRLLSQTLKSARDCVAVADLTDRLIFVNEAFLTTYGYTEVEIIGQPSDCLRGSDEGALLKPDIRTATLTEGGWHGELMNRRKDGTEFPVELWTSVVRSEAGDAIATVGVARDITERRKLETQLRQSQKMDGVGQLAGGVAHDFNNLLTVIQGHVSVLLEQGNLPAELRESITEIGHGSARAAELTRQLLTFSRRQPLRIAAHDLNTIVPSLSRMLQRLVGEHIAIRLQLAAVSLGVRADAAMLEQALLNLVVNARDAMPQGGSITIETGTAHFDERAAAQNPQARPGHFITLAVRDTGHGIAPEVLPHIFEPFYTTKDVGQGTGLGLATVFGIVQQHHGWVSVQSELQHGSTFRIFLPQHDGPNPNSDAVGDTVTPARRGTETILVVEDEVGVLSFIGKVLTRQGYRVLEAPTGVIALDRWAEHREEIRLVITDMVMPGGLSGRQLAERLQADRPALPIIFISGYSVEQAGQELPLQTGVNFLTKPFELRLLIDLVRRRLDEATGEGGNSC